MFQPDQTPEEWFADAATCYAERHQGCPWCGGPNRVYKSARGNVLEYRELAQHLGNDQPFYGFQSAGLDGKRAPHTQVEDMAAHYIKEMREL